MKIYTFPFVIISLHSPDACSTVLLSPQAEHFGNSLLMVTLIFDILMIIEDRGCLRNDLKINTSFNALEFSLSKYLQMVK